MRIKRIKMFLCIISIIIASTFWACCTTKNSTSAIEHSITLDFDSSDVKSTVIDSLLAIINGADSLTLYELCYPLLARDTAKYNIMTDTIAGFVMKMDSVMVSSDMVAVLKFIIGDKNVYQEDVPMVKQPYSPYISIKFYETVNDVYMLYSFSTNQLALATKEEILFTFRIRDWYSLERWIRLILPDNEYVNSKINDR